MKLKTILKISDERKEEVVKEISAGCEPGFRFYALLSTASLIAAFGLMANSTAVIIGAMLVSPLMTPIIGIAVSIVTGNPHLLGTSVRSVIIGVVLAIFFSSILGLLPLALDATPEMLLRTKPTILDLMVAILAGFAGAFTMIDEKSSPVLPGVAIATAIVPPLSNTGLSLALGYYYGAFGSFMLFFANFLSILIVAGATFVFAGLNPWWISFSTKDLIRRFGFAIIGFAAVAIFLTYSMVGIVRERYLGNSIRHILDTEILKYHGTTLDTFIYDMEKGKLYVLANVRSPKLITPDKIEMVQNALSQSTKLPTELVLRNVISKDVTAKGSTTNVVSQNLDGFFLKETLTEEEKSVREVEQLLFEKLSYWPGMMLMDVEYTMLPRGPTVIATIQGYRNLTENEIGELEQKLRENMRHPDMNLIVRNVEASFSDKRGELIPGWQYGGMTDEQMDLRDRIESEVMDKFKDYDDLFPTDIHHRYDEDSWYVLVEVVGARILRPDEVGMFEKNISDKLNHKINIDFWYRADAVITDKGFMPFEKFNEQSVAELDKYFSEKSKAESTLDEKSD